MFGFGKKKEAPKDNNLSFDVLPNGKYVAKYKDEIPSYDEFILVTLEVTHGEHKGKLLPMQFASAKAKKVTRDFTGGYLDHLDYEGEKKAVDLGYSRGYAEGDTNGSFIVNYKSGFVSSVPEYDYDKVKC